MLCAFMYSYTDATGQKFPETTAHVSHTAASLAVFQIGCVEVFTSTLNSLEKPDGCKDVEFHFVFSGDHGSGARKIKLINGVSFNENLALASDAMSQAWMQAWVKNHPPGQQYSVTFVEPEMVKAREKIKERVAIDGTETMINGRLYVQEFGETTEDFQNRILENYCLHRLECKHPSIIGQLRDGFLTARQAILQAPGFIIKKVEHEHTPAS